METSLTLVGTGDSLGVPRVYCDCAVCTEARTAGRNRRRRCAGVVQGREPLWLDCGPDWRAQMESLGLRDPGRVLITHAHHDHIGGIPDLADLARWVGWQVPLMAPGTVLAEIERRYPWVRRSLAFTPIDSGATWEDWRIDVWPVCHGANGQSHAYRFSRGGRAWAYCPDSIALSAEEKAPMHELQLLVLGTAYVKEPAEHHRRSLYDMAEALELVAELCPARTVFTHLSHGVDIRALPEFPTGIEVARDGLVMALP